MLNIRMGMPRVFIAYPILIRNYLTHLQISPNHLDLTVTMEIPCSTHESISAIAAFHETKISKE